MVLDLPTLSTTYILAARPRALEDFKTKERILDKATNAPLTRYTVATFGEYGIEQLIFKAPEVAGCEDWAPGTSIIVKGAVGNTWKPEGGSSLSAISYSAQSVTLAKQGQGGQSS
jgi:hypothetical protein